MFQQFFRGAVVAVGLSVGTAGVLAEELASETILPKYPTTKRQVLTQGPLDDGGSRVESSALKWRTAVKPLPLRSATIDQSAVRQASLNLRVAAPAESTVQPAVQLIPADAIVGDESASSVQQAQARSRFQPQPSLDPPSRLPSTTAPDVVDGDPGVAQEEPEVDPLFERPLTGDPELDLPRETDPAPSELPPLTEESFEDPEAARDFGLGLSERREQQPCRENFRDTNCCEETDNCKNAWRLLERNPVSGFEKGFLDITPLYRPDVRYSGKEEVDQEKARREGLAVDVLRTWKGANGMPLGVSEDGSILGLDGEDWLRMWEQSSRDAPEGGAPRPSELKGRAKNYQRGSSKVTIVTESGDEFTLELKQLSIDDNEWLNGRTWRDAERNVLARGRFYDYEWNRILVQDDTGRIVAVPYIKLGDEDLCYIGAYWGEGVGLPAECRLRGEPKIRNFTMITYTWKASGLCHKPLYFEEVQLERYGHTFGPVAQPFVSGAHFFANIAILPYKMGINPPTECQYALGYYRPGDCAPYMIPPVPLSVRAGLYQAGAVVGAVALFP